MTGSLFDQDSPLDKDHAFVSKNARDTSRQAAEEVAPRSGTQRARLLWAIVRAGVYGLTYDEAERLLKRVHQSLSARGNELEAGGWTKDSGERRKTRSGKNAIVWVATAKGREWYSGLGPEAEVVRAWLGPVKEET